MERQPPSMGDPVFGMEINKMQPQQPPIRDRTFTPVESNVNTTLIKVLNATRTQPRNTDAAGLRRGKDHHPWPSD
jgi:hypothetical protein